MWEGLVLITGEIGGGGGGGPASLDYIIRGGGWFMIKVDDGGGGGNCQNIDYVICERPRISYCSFKYVNPESFSELL